uniref:Uncharacterized protein n=1 Tax=Triticum urartu TaxID=4572 RepID=A0A8R7QA67_TRIUA
MYCSLMTIANESPVGGFPTGLLFAILRFSDFVHNK